MGHGDIYESAIPTKCIEDCAEGLIFADPIHFKGQAFVFACYCVRGTRHKHYPRWHPILSTKDYSRSKGEVSTTPAPGSEAKQEEIPAVLLDHFIKGDFISSAWDLHRETYGRDRLAQWYKVWKKDRI